MKKIISILVILAAIVVFFNCGDKDKKEKPEEQEIRNLTDVDMAVNQPYQYAWKLFLDLCTQAEPGKAGIPQQGKDIQTYDDDKPVVWETWALASGGRSGDTRSCPNMSEIFLDKGVAPKGWNDLIRDSTIVKDLDPLSAKHIEFLRESGVKDIPEVEEMDPSSKEKNKREFNILIDPTIPDRAKPMFEGGSPTGDEVRINKPAFEYIVKEKLYSIEGLENAFKKKMKIEFPKQAMEIKAQWVKIGEEQKKRYHWRTIKNKKGEVTLWGLSGLHIITKDIPNWFWCDFEHIDFIPHAEMKSFDSATIGKNAPFRGNVDGEHKGLTGTKWQFYRLRGVQIDFIDSKGLPVILANAQIEKGFQQTSSCMTCHARATVGLRSSSPRNHPDQVYSLTVFETRIPVMLGSLGSPNPTWFIDDRDSTKFIQTDFLWSLPMRACSENEKIDK